MVTIKEVAKQANVSVSTVSNVLNNRKNVGKETRERVLSICEELNYYPNMASKTLKSGNSNTILFCFSDFDRTFYLDILKGIHEFVEKTDFDFIITTSNVAKKYMQNNLTCGAIILDYRLDNEFIEKFHNERYPIVFLDRIIEKNNIGSVVVDNYNGMSELMHALVDRDYKKFAFIGGVATTADNIERFDAFNDILKEYNIEFDKNLYFDGNYKKSSGFDGAKYLIESSQDIDCIVCANDNMANGCIQYLTENGYNVPDDIAVTGFDYSEVSKSIGITTVKIPNFSRGYLACQTLINMILGNEVEPIVKVTPVFVEGKTIRD